MKQHFNKVVDGILKYIDAEVYSGMNDLQELAARVLIGRFVGNKENVKNMLIHNNFIRTFAIIDDEGMIELDSLMLDIRKELVKKQKITLSIPMFGSMTFTPSDVNSLYKTITGEELRTNEIN